MSMLSKTMASNTIGQDPERIGVGRAASARPSLAEMQMNAQPEYPVFPLADIDRNLKCDQKDKQSAAIMLRQ